MGSLLFPEEFLFDLCQYFDFAFRLQIVLLEYKYKLLLLSLVWELCEKVFVAIQL